MLAAAEWPFTADEAVRVELTHADHRWAIKAGADASAPWRFLFDTPLAVRSQPFDVVAERRIGWRELPWLAMLGTACAAASSGPAAPSAWRWSICAPWPAPRCI